MSAAPGERVETETQHRPPVSSPHLLLTPPAHEKSPANPRRAKVPYSDPLSAAERLSSTRRLSGRRSRSAPACCSACCLAQSFHSTDQIGRGFRSQFRITVRVSPQSSSCNSLSFHQGGSQPNEMS